MREPIEDHPDLTPERIAALSELAKKIDCEEADDLKAAAREIFKRYEENRKADRPLDIE